MPKKAAKTKSAAGKRKPSAKAMPKKRNGAVKRKRSAKSRLRPAKLEFIPSLPHHHQKPAPTYFGLSFTSIILLLSAAITSCIALITAGVDMERLERETQQSLAAQVQPQEYLRLQAETLGYDAGLLHHIAFCESGWRMVKSNKSSAFGYFQIIDATERYTPQYVAGSRKFDPYTNIDMALYLYGRYGVAPWTESKGCWGR